jgi:acyl-CoA thioesterase-2
VSTRLSEVLDLLDLERIEVDIFRGRQPPAPSGPGRVFGGHVAAQALMAATRTVDEGAVHSLHSYFLRPGDPAVPTVYEVDRIRDGRSFCTRRVVAIQHGRAIFNLQASFHVGEEGFEHQDTMPEAPDPESLPTAAELARDHEEEAARFGFIHSWPVDMRFVTEPPYVRRPGREPAQMVWIRADGHVGTDVALNRCLLTFVSDMILLSTQSLPHGTNYGPEVMTASIDHLVWFHRFHRVDDWVLYTMRSPSAYGARGFTKGSLWSRSGDLVASVAQEGLLRPVSAHR